MAMRLSSARPELPSRGELGALALGALFATTLFAGAFHVAASAERPLVEDDPAYRATAPVLRAVDAPEPPDPVLVVPQAQAASRHRRRHPRIVLIPPLRP